MRLVDKEISLKEIKRITHKSFGNLLKAVVDVEKEIMVIGGELHSDEGRISSKKRFSSGESVGD